MADVFDEVEEGLRQDRASTLWKKAQPWVIGAIVALIGGVAGYEIWKGMENNKQAANSRAFLEANGAAQTADTAVQRATDPQLNDTQRAAAAASAGAARTNALSKFETMAGSEGAYAQIAAQEAAEIALGANGDAAKAGALLEGAMKGDNAYSQLSRLKLAYLRADTASLAELTTLLDPLVKAGGPMASLSKELLAAKKLATGDTAGARADYMQLSADYNAPEGMRRRVNMAMAAIRAGAAGPAAAATPAPAPAASSAAPAASTTSPAPTGQAPQ